MSEGGPDGVVECVAGANMAIRAFGEVSYDRLQIKRIQRICALSIRVWPDVEYLHAH